MTAHKRIFILAAALVLPACKSAESACKHAKEVTKAEGKAVSNAACLMRMHDLKGAERDALVDCLSAAADGDAVRACLD